MRADPNLALHWILVPESWRSSFLVFGKDRDHDSLPELYLRVGEPVGTQWMALLRRAEWRPDSFNVLVLELAGSDGSERQRWPDDSAGPSRLVVGRDASIHFHTQALNSDDVCLTHEPCVGALSLDGGVGKHFLLDGKRTEVQMEEVFVRNEEADEFRRFHRLLQGDKVIREFETGEQSAMLMAQEFLDRGFCLRFDTAENSDGVLSYSCWRIDLATGQETQFPLPEYDDLAIDLFREMHAPDLGANGQVLARIEHESATGLALLEVPLDPPGALVELANFPQLEYGTMRNLSTCYLPFEGATLSLCCYFNDERPGSLQFSFAIPGKPIQTQSIDSLPSNAIPSDPLRLNDLDARVIADQDGDQREDFALSLHLSNSTSTVIGYLTVSSATGEILPR